MHVFHVVQIVSPSHKTSYKPGKNWCDSFVDHETARRWSEVFNYHRSPSCIGVHYTVIGPVDETIPFEELTNE